jgi:hypothetical protein
MEPARDVAFFALLYREAWRKRWLSLDDILTDQDIAPGELSWFSMLAAQYLDEADWLLMRRIAEHDEPSALARIARDADPFRAEALLHAADHHCRRKWATAYAARKRWDRVEVFMGVFEREGLTATRDDVEALASSAWQAATGDTYGQYLDRWVES